MSTVATSIERVPDSDRWERAVPVYGFPLVNGFFLGLLGLVIIALGSDRVSRARRPRARSAA